MKMNLEDDNNQADNIPVRSYYETIFHD